MARKGTSWPDCWAKVTNREWLDVVRVPLTGAQLRIVIYLVVQTRGTGAINGGAASARMDAGDSPTEVFEDALAGGYGRDLVEVYAGQISSSLKMNVATVWRELRRLEDAGLLVVHRRGTKGRAAVLSINLDPATWSNPDLSAWDDAHPARHEADRRRAVIPCRTARENTECPSSRQGKTPNALAVRQGSLEKGDFPSEKEETAESRDPADVEESSKTGPCQWCGEPLPASGPHTGRPRKFCPGFKCKNAASKAHRAELAATGGPR
jgi:hypothetical protein